MNCHRLILFPAFLDHSLWKLAGLALSGSLISACALPPTSEPSGDRSSISTERDTTGSSPCAVTLVQNGKRLTSTKAGRIDVYILDAEPFRLEVSFASCQPSIGAVRHATDLMYVAGARYVVSSPEYSMAGSLRDQDVLVHRIEDPRLPIESTELFTPDQRAYAIACKHLGKCPALIRAFRSYWPFFADESGTQRTFAEFNRLTEGRPLEEAYAQTRSIVVYTRAMDIAQSSKSAFVLTVLETHPIWLQFRPKHGATKPSRIDLRSEAPRRLQTPG